MKQNDGELNTVKGNGGELATVKGNEGGGGGVATGKHNGVN